VLHADADPNANPYNDTDARADADTDRQTHAQAGAATARDLAGTDAGAFLARTHFYCAGIHPAGSGRRGGGCCAGSHDIANDLGRRLRRHGHGLPD
jgi:hypothetical protein